MLSPFVINWKSTLTKSKKARMSKSKFKCILICFFDIHGIVHKEIVPRSQTFPRDREVLENLRKRVVRVRPNIKNDATISINYSLANKYIRMAPQPPYSPDMIFSIFRDRNITSKELILRHSKTFKEL